MLTIICRESRDVG